MILTLFAALFSLGLTLAILWANPYRFSNQAFALVTTVQTIWLVCVYRAKQTDVLSTLDKIIELEEWQRANAAVIAFLPATIWLLKNSIIFHHNKLKAIVTSLPLFALSILGVFLCYHDSFIHRSVGEGLLLRGNAYYIYIFLELTVYAICIVQIYGQMRIHTGIRRVELQFLALNAGGAGLLIGSLNALGNYLNVRAFNRTGLFLGFAASALTAWALLFHRVFNAREVLLQFGQRISVVLVLTAGIYSMWRVTSTVIAEPFGLLISAGLCGPMAIWFDRKSSAWFDAEGKRKLVRMRTAAIDLARPDLQAETIIQRFEALLRTESNAFSANILFDAGDTYKAGTLAINKGSPAYEVIRDIGWATPESLLRRRSTPNLESLKQLMEEKVLGLIISIPPSSPIPSLLIALGRKIDEGPFTYPEVQRLQNLALLMDNILTRSRLAAQAALQARIEHLAMMSRGMAHDLKNLMTPVSSFLIHIDGRLPADSAEADVHAAAQRSMRIVNDYIREALFFSERREPRFEQVDLTRVFAAACQAVEERAARRGVVILSESRIRASFIADSVLLQRMLANLVGNAIDASSNGQTVSVIASDSCAGWLRIEVTDQGCGIPPENISRVFDPYFTTKEFGDAVRGFGLGLTICQKIVLLHRGKIIVQSRPDRGTTFTVELPTVQMMTPHPTSAA